MFYFMPVSIVLMALYVPRNEIFKKYIVTLNEQGKNVEYIQFIYRLSNDKIIDNERYIFSNSFWAFRRTFCSSRFQNN